MALPDSNAQWPPTSLNKPLSEIRRYDAWYRGDIDDLEQIYSTQVSGGFWGQMKRFFMGAPKPGETAQRPDKIHVPLAAEIAKMSAAQLFSEMPTVHFGDMDGDLDDRGITNKAQGEQLERALTDLLDDETHATLLEGAELASAHGGNFYRIAWDAGVAEHPFITAVAADRAVPEFRWGRLSGLTIWSDLEPLKGSRMRYKLLEYHTPGSIEYGLYESSDEHSIGVRVPLETHPATAPLARLVNANSQVPTGSTLMTACYIPNVKPNRQMRSDPIGQHLGRSDFDEVESLFDQLDEVYSSWSRDIRLGKARIFASRDMLKAGKPGEGSSFNTDQEIFTPLSLPPGSQLNQDKLLEMFQPNIRWQEHQATAQGLIERIYTACGYSSSTFGQSGDVAMTATEAQAREKLTMLTRSSKILYTRPQLRKLFAALMDVNTAVFHGPSRGEAIPDIEFPPAATDAPNVVAQTLNLLASSESASIGTRVQMLHPGWSDTEISEEVATIQQETSAAVPIPDISGLEGIDDSEPEPSNESDSADSQDGDSEEE
jgi:A118 family predicted phage portal protein